MNDDRAKTPRTLLVADHLWDAIASMAAEMGSDRDALINQALYTFARLNGYLVPADLKRMGSVPPPPAAAPPERRGTGASSRPPPTALVSAEEARSMRPPANAERVAELAQQLGSSNTPQPRSTPPPVPAKGGATEGNIEVDDSLLGDEGRKATSMDLPNLAELGLSPRKTSSALLPNRTLPESPSEPPGLPDGAAAAGGHTLVLLADGRELERVVKDRFLIGRGKHCDLIINSGKVSREHAAITREGAEYFIEDLGSSNGTWHDKRRITRRQIQEGDEYFICAEKLGCTFR